MSLVNDMLRDLEDRQDSSAANIASTTNGFANREPSHPAAKIALGAGAALMACAAGLWYWQSQSNVAAETTPAIAASEAPQPAATPMPAKVAAQPAVEPQTIKKTLAVEEPALAAIESVELEPATATAPVAITEPVETINDRPNLHELRELLAKAELALQKNRLTTPIDDNAFDYYRAVLAIDSEHPEALYGIEQIRQRYQQWAVAAHQQGDTSQALAQLERALMVSPQSDELLALKQQFRDTQKPTPRVPLEAVASSSQSIPQVTTPVASPATTSAASVATASVTTSTDTLDRQAVATADQLAQSGSAERAINLLSDHIAKYPAARHSTERLAKLYLQRGDEQQLFSLLDNTPALANDQAAELKARLRLQQNNLPAALSLLEQQPPAIVDNTGYHSLLAGLYQKSGKYRQAAAVYSKLVAVEQQNPRHWLGLAVALDALNDPAALRAFKRARSGTHNNTQVSSYIDQRIAALSSS